MAKQPAKQPPKQSRQRSPNYPAVGLQEAVVLVARLIAKDGKAGALLPVAVKQMGFGGLHGASKAVLSALRKFKLIDDQHGRIVPTPAAIDIVRFPANHPRREQALQLAALSPAIYKEIVDRYAGHGELPSDESLRPEIETDWDFNPKMVSGFLKDFRESLVYAGLLDGNRLLLSGEGEPSQETSEEEESSQEDVTQMRTERNAPSVLDPPSAVMERAESAPSSPIHAERPSGVTISFPLPRGNVLEIRMRSKVTPEEFAKVKRIFELSEVAFLEDETPQSGAAPEPPVATPAPETNG